jgi:hypothetical protein
MHDTFQGSGFDSRYRRSETAADLGNYFTPDRSTTSAGRYAPAHGRPAKTIVKMKTALVALLLVTVSAQWSIAQETTAELEVVDLSKNKWQWMAEKNVGKLATLFDARSKFVHMSGTWNKDRELEIIETGSIWYKQADVHDVVVEVSDDTAVLWNRITLQAVVRGNEVSNEFTVTEVYQKRESDWKLLALTFSSVRDTHSIEH